MPWRSCRYARNGYRTRTHGMSCRMHRMRSQAALVVAVASSQLHLTLYFYSLSLLRCPFWDPLFILSLVNDMPAQFIRTARRCCSRCEHTSEAPWSGESSPAEGHQSLTTTHYTTLHHVKAQTETKRPHPATARPDVMVLTPAA